jgi:hypothetical protein
MEPGDGSVPRWLGQLQGGDALAVRQLWQRYFHRLVGLARQRLRGSARRVADAEDVALIKRKLHLILNIWEKERTP